MRLAILSDIHANIYAFEAVVKDLRKESPDHIVFLGDLIINGLCPRECYNLLEDLKPMICIKGNTDAFHEYFLENPAPESAGEQYCKLLDDYATAKLTTEELAGMAALDIYEKRLIGGEPIGFCHGTPQEIDAKMTLEELKADQRRDILDLDLHTLFCGHTHRPEQFFLGDLQTINFGAVGYSFDRNRQAAYGIVDINSDGVFPIQKRVTYDSAAYLLDIRAADVPFRDNLAFIIEHACPPSK